MFAECPLAGVRGEKFMAILLLSVMLSMILGSLLWLVIGNQLPLKSADKFPPLNNIAYYSAVLIAPVLLVIFFTY